MKPYVSAAFCGLLTIIASRPAWPAQTNTSMMMQMPSSIAVTDPMSREGSGTSWLPDTTPVYAKMWMESNGNSFMIHGAAMPRYTDVGSSRGDHKWDAPNWFMGMFAHPLSPTSQLGMHLMMSLDPITESGYGYPLLYQTGESWHGLPLHDRQHPHDLISELSATYSKDIGNGRSAYLYLGYPGEPALGPPAYMHRLIAQDFADAPIGHHWQDATHITFGVATLGMGFSHNFKVEASSFTGREPNENRYNFDDARWDSASGRLSWNPDSRDAFAVSYGYIKNPEGDGVDQHRQATSWIFDNPLHGDSNLTTTLSWGQNDAAAGDGKGVSNSYLVEIDYQRGANTLFGRMEQIQKSGAELVLPTPNNNNRLYWLGVYTVGYVRDLSHGTGIDTGLGAAISIDPHPASLNAFYGGQVPISFQIFLRFRASRQRTAQMGMGDMAMMNMPVMTTVPQTELPPSGPAVQSPTAAQPTGSLIAPSLPSPVVTPPESATLPIAPTTTLPKAQAMISALVSLSPVDVIAGKPTTVTVFLTNNTQPISGALISTDVAMTSMDMGTSHPKFKEVAPGKYTASAIFAMAGPWKLSVHVKIGTEKLITKALSVKVGN